MRVLVCGSRDWHDPYPIHVWLDGLYETMVNQTLVVIHGAAQGADMLAHTWAIQAIESGLDVMVIPVPAQWDKFGKRAGFLRNEQMRGMDPDLVLGFSNYPITKGTRMMLDLAIEDGIRTYVVGCA